MTVTGEAVVLHLVGAGESYFLEDCCWLRHCPLAQSGCYPQGGDPLYPRKSSCCPSDEESILLGASRRRDEGPAPRPVAAHVSIESLLEQVKHLCWHRVKDGEGMIRGTKQAIRHLQAGCRPLDSDTTCTLEATGISNNSCFLHGCGLFLNNAIKQSKLGTGIDYSSFPISTKHSVKP